MNALASALSSYDVQNLINLVLYQTFRTAAYTRFEHHLTFVSDKEDLRKPTIRIFLVIPIDIIDALLLPEFYSMLIFFPQFAKHFKRHLRIAIVHQYGFCMLNATIAIELNALEVHQVEHEVFRRILQDGTADDIVQQY